LQIRRIAGTRSPAQSLRKLSAIRLWQANMTDLNTAAASPLADSARPAAEPLVAQGALGDYVALMKPRVMSLCVFTALAGMIAAPVPVHPIIAVTALIFIAMGAGAAGALNMWYDADIDALMARTALRPIPRNRLPREEALAFGLVLAIGSVFCLGVLVNWVASALLALTIAYYFIIYTIWLKRRTPQNIVIGGAAGSFPPMIGWAVATGGISLESILLFAIIFLWTPPHFWALALVRSRDYERAGVPMLPVVAGKDRTRREILIYSIVMAVTGALPGYFGPGGLLYLVTASLSGAIFVALAWRVYRERQGVAADKEARRLFAFSVFYLFGLFAVLIIEHALGWA
jgi:protoheme IX farnesyltransferase